jgi:hypothetical protein
MTFPYRLEAGLRGALDALHANALMRRFKTRNFFRLRAGC